MAAPVRICGVGSPFGEDQIGWRAVEFLEQSRVLQDLPAGMVKTCLCDGFGPRLLEILKGAELVIIIDAMISGAVPGTVQRVQQDSLEVLASPCSTHGFDLASTLALGGVLEQLPSQLFIYGIEIEVSTASLYPPGSPLNPALAAAMPELIKEVETILKTFTRLLNK